MTILVFVLLAFFPYMTACSLLAILSKISGVCPKYSNGEKFTLPTLLLASIAVYLFTITSVALGVILLTGISVLIQG